MYTYINICTHAHPSVILCTVGINEGETNISRTPVHQVAQMQCGILFFSQQQKQGRRRDGGGRTGLWTRLRARASASRGGVPGHGGWVRIGRGWAWPPLAPIKLSAPSGQKITKFCRAPLVAWGLASPGGGGGTAGFRVRSVCVGKDEISVAGEPPSHGGDDDQQVGNVTDTVQQVGGDACHVLVGELARGEDVDHVRRLLRAWGGGVDNACRLLEL